MKLLSISLFLLLTPGVLQAVDFSVIPVSLPIYRLEKPEVLKKKDYNLFRDEFRFNIKPIESPFKPYNPFNTKGLK